MEIRDQRPVGRMLLLAALLHLLIFLLPFEAGLDERPILRTIQLELTVPRAPEPEEASNQPASRARSLPGARANRRPVAPMSPATAEARTAGAIPEPTVAKTSPAEATPTAGEEAAEAIDLFPETLLARLAGGDAPAEPITEEGRIRKRVHTYVRELQSRDRVQMGLIDPYFRALGESFRGAFEPDWSAYDPKSGKKGLGGALRAWMQDYGETADRYALSGSPYREGERDHALLRGGEGTLPDTSVSGARSLGGMGEMAALRDLWNDAVHGKAGGVEILALVRVSQAPDGALLRVEIETPSGRPAYDRLALRSVRTALAEPLRPPEYPRAGNKGLGLAGESIESLWAFRTRFTVTPPAWTIVPMAGIGGIGSAAGCDLGVGGGLGKCFTPLSRQAFPHLELIAVY